MIANSNLNTDTLLDHHNILTHAAGDRRRGIFIRTSEAICSQATFTKCFGFSHQTLHTAGSSIRTQQANQRCNTGLHRCRKLQRRHLVGKTAFTATTGDMYVLINVTGNSAHSTAIDYFQIRNLALDFIRNLCNALVSDQHLRCFPFSITV